MSEPETSERGQPVNEPPPDPPAVAPAHVARVAPAAVASAATTYASIVLKPAAYDPVVAQGLLETWRPRLAALPYDGLSVPRLDVHAAALAALSVHAFVTQAQTVHARLRKLSDIGEFEIARVEDLKSAAFLVLYTHAQAETAGAFATDAKVPAKLIQEGTEVESRMQELCEYKFKRDPTIAPQLALLSPGTGHRDLATDLLGYADIYQMRPAEAASDTTNYRPTDVESARRIAGEILSYLSAAMSPKAKEAYELLQRAWTLLLQIYFEVQEVGRVLIRHDPKRDERFPSLFAAGRSGRPRKKKGDDAEEKKTGAAEPPPGK
jgi:hypothetical protein